MFLYIKFLAMNCVISISTALFQTEVCVDVDLWEETVDNQCLTGISGSATGTCPDSPCSTTITSLGGKLEEFFNPCLFLEFNVCYKNFTSYIPQESIADPEFCPGCPRTSCGNFLFQK